MRDVERSHLAERQRDTLGANGPITVRGCDECFVQFLVSLRFDQFEFTGHCTYDIGFGQKTVAGPIGVNQMSIRSDEKYRDA
jgi:hypothetical protein